MDGWMCMLGATVPTGLEISASEECHEMLGRPPKYSRGKLIFPLQSMEELVKVRKLRSVDNIYVVVGEIPDFCKDEESVLKRLRDLPMKGEGSMKWATPFKVWCYYQTLVAGITSSDIEASSNIEASSDIEAPPDIEASPDIEAPPDIEASSDIEAPPDIEASSDIEAPPDIEAPLDIEASSDIETPPDIEAPPDTPPDIEASSDIEAPPDIEASSSIEASLEGSPITFRVTCKRGGHVHCFTSMDAAGHLGAGLAGKYGWKAQMKGGDIEVLLTVSGDAITIALALNKESLYKRNISYFGPTTLRSTIAYGLLRCANIQAGDIVVDPFCGGGSISIEGSLAWKSTYHLAGDLHELALPRTRANLQALEDKVAIDVLRWDVCNLPLKSNSIDVIVTDMPFGKKCGTLRVNWILYPLALQELGRVCRSGSARAIILTHHHKAFSKALQNCPLWKRIQTRWINVGGLKVAVYLLLHAI